MEGIIALSTLFSFIVVIFFFKLCNDVSSIKRHMMSENPDFWIVKYQKSKYLHRDAEALRSLEEYVWSLLKKQKHRAFYDSLKEKYSEDFVKLGSEFPQYPY